MYRKINKYPVLFAVMAFICLTAGIAAAATVTPSFTYQGKLTNASGSPLTGTYSVTFKLYDTSTGGTALSTDTHGVTATNGLFATTVTADPQLPDGRALWLGIKVGSDPEMTPRQAIRPVPYALGLRPGAVINVTGSQMALYLLKYDDTYGGLYVDTYGKYNAGVRSIVNGRSSSAFSAETLNVFDTGYQAVVRYADSDGVSVRTESGSSTGYRATIQGDNSAGVSVNTSGFHSPGVDVSTSNDNSYGVYAITKGTDSDAVRAYTLGENSAALYGNSAQDVGVYGTGKDGGVYGWSISGNGVTGSGVNGGYFTTTQPGGTGIHVANTGQNEMGIWVETALPQSVGVLAETSAADSNAIFGSTTGSSSYGVYGIASADNVCGVAGGTTGSGSPGVFGASSGPGAPGVKGSSAQGIGVQGISPVAGVKGESPTGQGVIGTTTSGYGVYGESNTGVAVVGYDVSNSGMGVEGVGNTGVWAESRTAGGTGLVAKAPASGGKAAIFYGNVVIKSKTTQADLLEFGEGLDYSEGFDVSGKEAVAPGTVLVISPDDSGSLTVSSEPYDRKVAGIVAGANGLGSAVKVGGDQFDTSVALAGRVYCNVDATYGAVNAGDQLTTSATPGYAMVVQDYTKAQGATIGKAMQGLDQGQKGQILVLVTLQ